MMWSNVMFKSISLLIAFIIVAQQQNVNASCQPQYAAEESLDAAFETLPDKTAVRFNNADLSFCIGTSPTSAPSSVSTSAPAPATGAFDAVIFTFVPATTGKYTISLTYDPTDTRVENNFIVRQDSCVGPVVTACENMKFITDDLFRDNDRGYQGVAFTAGITYFIIIRNDKNPFITWISGVLSITKDSVYSGGGTDPGSPNSGFPSTPEDFELALDKYIVLVVAITGGILGVALLVWVPTCCLCARSKRETDRQTPNPDACTVWCCSGSIFVKARVLCFMIWLSALLIFLSDWAWIWSLAAYGFSVAIAITSGFIFYFLLHPTPHSNVIYNINAIQITLVSCGILLLCMSIVIVAQIVIDVTLVCSTSVVSSSSPSTLDSFLTVLCNGEKFLAGYGGVAIAGIVCQASFAFELYLTIGEIVREMKSALGDMPQLRRGDLRQQQQGIATQQMQMIQVPNGMPPGSVIYILPANQSQTAQLISFQANPHLSNPSPLVYQANESTTNSVHSALFDRPTMQSSLTSFSSSNPMISYPQVPRQGMTDYSNRQQPTVSCNVNNSGLNVFGQTMRDSLLDSVKDSFMDTARENDEIINIAPEQQTKEHDEPLPRAD
jgi:hypothetical protein